MAKTPKQMREVVGSENITVPALRSRVKQMPRILYRLSCGHSILREPSAEAPKKAHCAECAQNALKRLKTKVGEQSY